jgi:uroporphyrinogen III methyltransferase/synthase
MKTHDGKGKVWLVGAGPGDIELITIKAVRCLKEADVVVYDHHLNKELLDYADAGAELIYAGKQGGYHTMSQEEISGLLIARAREGKFVCRLKGGDPFVFGRGGEEAEALSEAGIPFEVVPGVSSAIAAAAYAGIPLTHRAHSSSFAIVPGSEAATKTGSRIDWPKISTGVDTLVFLMAVANMPHVVAELLKNGRPPDTPVAVVQRGTRSDQFTVVGTLASIEGLAVSSNIRPPAVIIVGEVVKLRERLKWFGEPPLSEVESLKAGIGHA